MGPWEPEHLTGDLMLLFPEKNTRRFYFGVGGSSFSSALPDSVTLDVGPSIFNHMPDKLEFALGQEAILAVGVQSDEVMGFDAPDMQGFLEENLRLGKYERILVYMVRFTPIQ